MLIFLELRLAETRLAFGGEETFDDISFGFLGLFVDSDVVLDASCCHAEVEGVDCLLVVGFLWVDVADYDCA